MGPAPSSAAHLVCYRTKKDTVDREDSKFQTLFKQAGLRVVRAEIQKGLHPGDPDKLYPVKMYALRPE